LFDSCHDALGHIAVEGIIGRKYNDSMLFENVFVLEGGRAHFDAERFGFV